MPIETPGQWRNVMIFLIVEGSDNSGKTTLCKMLAREIHMPIQHSGGPPKSQEELNKRIERLMAMRSPMIFDRFPVISDNVYGPVCRNQNWITETHRVNLKKTNPIIIYCRPPIETIMYGHSAKAHEDPNHILTVNEMIQRIVERYDEIIDNYDYIFYDFTQSSMQFNALLIRYLREKVYG